MHPKFSTYERNKKSITRTLIPEDFKRALYKGYSANDNSYISMTV
jgi:hypothetical protein